MKSIYLFRRDLRFFDNRGLMEALSKSDVVAPIFIIEDDEAKLESPKFRLIIEILMSLGDRVNVFYGNTIDILEELSHKFDAIYTSHPWSWSEDELIARIEKFCQSKGLKFFKVVDNVLANPLTIKPSYNFKSFYSIWKRNLDLNMVVNFPLKKLIRLDGPSLKELIKRHGWIIESKWCEWLSKRIKSFNFKRYAELKDYPYLDGTSRLSPFINLGVISIRYLYSIAKECEEFIRQMAWREYYYHLKMRYPFMKNLELKANMRNIKWENNKEYILAFKEARTGYPIIDAGVRQLKQENWIHNRVRLIMANFFVKDLHIDWRIGEEFFKEYLIDYDEVLNVGNWQWCASVGVDPLPMRIFNPIIQASKYDSQCLYIKKYIPELEGYECHQLHDPLKYKIKGYYEPIVNHYEQVAKYRKAFLL